MLQNLSTILIQELQMNRDFFLGFKENLQNGQQIVPESFLYHISNKYSIPLDELKIYNTDILSIVTPFFPINNPKKPLYTKSKFVDVVPVAEFKKI